MNATEPNTVAANRMCATDPMLVDVRPAAQAVELEPDTLLTSGAPMPWDHYAGGQRRALVRAAISTTIDPQWTAHARAHLPYLTDLHTTIDAHDIVSTASGGRHV
ncbi:MAG: hypothetical protein ACRDP6_18325 [Actinoallomurus sp.]